MKKFIAGMNKDPERVDQLENTYRDALNANIYSIKGAVASEQSNKAIAPDFNDGENPIKEIIGQCSLEDGRIVLFVKLLLREGDPNVSAITVVSPKNNTHEIIYIDEKLNFQSAYTIEATAKISSKNNILVYFTDNYILKETNSETGITYIKEYNPPRVIDITKQINSLAEGSNTLLYGSSEFNVDKLDLFLNAGEIPEFANVRIDEGGGVVTGTYHLALAYKDDDGNETNYLATSNQVYIVSAHEDAFPTDVIAGDPQGSQTNKAIVWNINIPAKSNYSKVQPVVIQRFGGGLNQQSSEFAYKLQEQILPEFTGEPRRIEITYTGLESVAGAAISEVLIDTVRYETAKTLVQLDNRLFLSNLESRGDIGYQRFANSISIKPAIKSISNFDPKYYNVVSLNAGYSVFDRVNNSPGGSNLYSLEADFTKYDIQKNLNDVSFDFSGTTRKGYKDLKLSHKFKSFRRSEIYSFYISFVLKDGTETYAYHIPGRESRNISYDSSEADASFNETDFISDLDPEIGITTEEITNLYPDSKAYQILDTAFIDQNSNDGMGFWENQNEKYPDTIDFDTYSVETETGVPVSQGTIRTLKVRHHKMPSNKDSGFGYVSNDGTQQYSSPPLDASTNMSNTSIQELSLTDKVRILGIRLDNIKIPKFIIEQVQGYKIYYAKREQNNKTILGQSISVPGAFLPNTTQSVGSPNPSPYSAPERSIWFSGSLAASKNGHNQVSRGDQRYQGSPLISFHDFNLLKNKHSLSVATHIDVQKAIVFRQWAGGKGNRKKVDSSTFFVDDAWQVAPIDEVKIKAYVTSVLIASGYFNPDSNAQFGNTAGFGNGALTSINSIYTILPKSITYLPGDTSLKTTGGLDFHGIDRIINFKGETKIVIGLASGLPRLRGWHPEGVVTRSEDGNDFSSWYRSGGYYRINSNNNEEGSKRLFANVDNEELYPNPTDYPIGRPAAFLVNLCSLKTDVYKSFDDQKLVWTGYYKKIEEEDIKGYYEGKSSDAIFGGDTYISRYSFRSTGVPYGFSTLFRQSDSNQASPNDIPFSVDGDIGYIGNISTGEAPSWEETSNWAQSNNTVTSTLFSFLCETDDLLAFRHSADQTAGVTEDEGMLFDKSVASDVIFNGPDNDNTHMDNLLYMNNYSLNQDLRVSVPFPKSLNSTTNFPTRTIRSQNDEGSLRDKYREFLALEFKDIPKNRGDIWKLFALGSVLYMHTERSLFATKGKENLQLGDGSQAFIGSGDIFQQDPDELIPTSEGYGGTDSQFASLTTRYGQFFFNKRDKKAYIYSEGVVEASAAGMEKWFLENTPYEIEQYGIDLDINYRTDSPTDFFGFAAAYDPKFKRILLTKRELVPTETLIADLALGVVQIQNNIFVEIDASGGKPRSIDFSETKFFRSSGWTVSYYPELKIWGSRHTYVPRLYSNTAEEYYSLINAGDSTDTSTIIWEHSDYTKSTTFFNVESKFEFEYIDNTNKGYSKVFSSIYYSADIVNIKEKGTLIHKHINPGFTDVYVYNTRQISSTLSLSYIENCRLVNDLWYMNQFRDIALIDPITNLPSETETMFIEEGIVNDLYRDNNKSWFAQSRFTDTYLGVRLSSTDNDNFVYLYSAGTKHRNSYR